MRTISFIHWQRWLPCFIAVVLLVPNSGCLAAALTAGAVGAGAGGYMYVQGNVLHDYNANFDQTWNATLLALKDLGLPVLKADRDNECGTILSQTGDGDKIKITLEPKTARIPAEGQWTHVGVRVAMFGDNALSERIINQIDAHLAPPIPPGAPIVPVQTALPPGGPILPVQTGPPPQLSH